MTTIRDELRKIAEEPVPSEELEKARSFAKGRFVLSLESPHGTILFGLRREVLEGEAEEPDAVLAGLDAVTGEDVAARGAGHPRQAAAPRGDRAVRRARALRAAPHGVAGAPAPTFTACPKGHVLPLRLDMAASAMGWRAIGGVVGLSS